MYCHHRAVSVTVCPLWFCNHHTACPGMIHGPLPRLARRGRDPALLVVPGTGAPSPRPHCSPPLAALHPHPLTPSMPSPRSQLSHTARYPTATHHPSKSGSIRVSQVAQCDVMLSIPPPPHPLRDPQRQPDACMVGPMHGILFIICLDVSSPPPQPICVF